MNMVMLSIRKVQKKNLATDDTYKRKEEKKREKMVICKVIYT